MHTIKPVERSIFYELISYPPMRRYALYGLKKWLIFEVLHSTPSSPFEIVSADVKICHPGYSD